MEILQHAFNGILIIILIIACGFALERRGWFSDDSITLIAKLVTQVCLPTYMLANILRNFTHEQFVSMSRGLIVPLISMLAGYFVSKILARLVGVPQGRRGIFTACVAFSNVIFIGLPLTVALFGELAVPYIMLYYFVNTSLFWTLGVYEIASDSNRPASLWSKQTLSSIFSPPFLGFVLGVALVLLEIKMPEPLIQACAYIGSMTSPLAMMFIGIAMSKTKWQEIRFDFQMLVAMLARYFVCPLIILALLPFFELEPMMQRVFVIIAAMPVMTNSSIIARAYDADYKYAAMLVAVSTVLAAVVIPFYMWLIH